MIDLDAIRQRRQAATPGPWEVRHNEAYPDIITRDARYSGQAIGDVCNSRHMYVTLERSEDHANANAEFIAHAPADIDALIAEVERLTDALHEIANAYTAHGYSDAMDAVQNLKDIAREAINAKR